MLLTEKLFANQNEFKKYLWNVIVYFENDQDIEYMPFLNINKEGRFVVSVDEEE